MPADSSPRLKPPRFQTLRAVVALMLREATTVHSRAAGGYLWAILEPVGGIALLSVIFSLALAAPPLGRDFALFYATGFLPFTMYLDISQKISAAIRFNKPLLFYPGVSFFDAILARLVLGTLSQSLVFAIVVAGVIGLNGLSLSFELPSVVLALAQCAALAAGVGTLNCFLVSYFPIWERLWAIGNRPLFVVSSIFFLFEGVPEPWRDWLWYNPLVHVIGQMRKGIYPVYSGDFVSSAYVFAVAGTCLVLGLIFLRRYHREILDL